MTIKPDSESLLRHMGAARRAISVIGLTTWLGVLSAAGGCEEDLCEGGLQGALLQAALTASDAKRFDKALGNHGPVEASELPCLEAAATSGSANKRRFAATMMGIVSNAPDKRRQAATRVATKTSDLVVWATLTQALLDDFKGADSRSDGHAEAIGRADMIHEALKFTDADEPKLAAKVQRVGIRAGLWTKMPGMNEVLIGRLDARDPTVTIVLNALPNEDARRELPRLMKMLERYEAGERVGRTTGPFFTALISAIVRTGDSEGASAARTALVKDYTDPRSIHGTRRELMTFRNAVAFTNEPEMMGFLLALIRDGHKLRPLAYDALCTAVSTDSAPPGVELVTACVGIRSGAWDETSTMRQAEWGACGDLLTFMAAGKNPRKTPVDVATELEHARKWLADCESSHACAR